MKKAATYLFVLILATLVFYGGAGVNIISYCCSDCRTEGVEVLLDDACCDVHEHNHGDVELLADEVPCDSLQSMLCDIERVDFDWMYASSQGLDLQPAVFDLFSFGIPDISLILGPILNKLTSITPTRPPFICPRIYLSLLTTLLI